MPIVNRGRPSSSMLPANARAADVASRLVETIMPIQQHRTSAAFRVQGIEAVLYNQLSSGRPCSCRSAEKQLSFLNPDGKAPQGIINRLISGREFDVTPYSNRPEKMDEQNGFYADVGPYDTHKVTGPDLSEANENVATAAVGDSGAYDPENLDDLVNMFDASDVGFSDVSCPISFGSSFVGGYTPYRSWRRVVVPQDLVSDEYIDFTATPWELEPCQFSFEAILPRGALAVDSLRVWRRNQQIQAPLLVDGVPINHTVEFLAFCDGRSHTLTFTVEDPVTHVELQLSLSAESAFFEIPKLSKGGDMSFLEHTDPFQILLSPEVPHVRAMDVIVESQLGKALLVGSVGPWQTRNRSAQAWECQVRVIQPQELYSLLPKRGKIYGQRTTNFSTQAKFNRSSGL